MSLLKPCVANIGRCAASFYSFDKPGEKSQRLNSSVLEVWSAAGFEQRFHLLEFSETAAKMNHEILSTIYHLDGKIEEMEAKEENNSNYAFTEWWDSLQATSRCGRMDDGRLSFAWIISIQKKKIQVQAQAPHRMKL